MGVHIIVAVAEALGHDVEQLVISRSSIRRMRKANRREESENIQTDMVVKVLLV